MATPGVDRTDEFHRCLRDAGAIGSDFTAEPALPVSSARSSFLREAGVILVEIRDVWSRLRGRLRRPATLEAFVDVFGTGASDPRGTVSDDEFYSGAMAAIKQLVARTSELRDAIEPVGAQAVAGVVAMQRSVVGVLFEVRALERRVVARPLPPLISPALLATSQRLADATMLVDQGRRAVLQAATRRVRRPPAAAFPVAALGGAGGGAGGTARAPRPTGAELPGWDGDGEDDEDFDDADRAALALEHEQLVREMTANEQDVQRMEATLSEISAMIQQLTDQMLLQHGMIETISDHAQDSVTNIKQANEQLAQAAESSSKFRYYIMVLLITGSLILLFLDWYS